MLHVCISHFVKIAISHEVDKLLESSSKVWQLNQGNWTATETRSLSHWVHYNQTAHTKRMYSHFIIKGFKSYISLQVPTIYQRIYEKYSNYEIPIL